MLDLLSQVGIFQGLSAGGMTRLAELATFRTFSPESHLMEQGKPSDCMYVILRGTVRVERGHPQLTEPVVIAVLEAGEPVGEMGVLDAEPRSATVTAAEETSVAVITAAALSEILLANPGVGSALLRILSRRIRTTDELAALYAPVRRPAVRSKERLDGKAPKSV